MPKSSCRLVLFASFFMAAGSITAFGQQLPDAPDAFLADGQSSGQKPVPDSGGAYTPPPDGQQTKRILGIIPNFRSVSTDAKLPPLTVKDKFVEASQDNFDYSAVFLPAVLALYSEATNKTPEFRKGGEGYGRYFWHTLVDQDSENYFVEFIVPAITREDPRYYTKGRGGFLKRTGYSLSRVVVTRTDKDTETFNFSEILGSGASAGVSNLYYPTRQRSVGNTLDQWGTDIGIDGLTFVFKEFWPDINQKLFHGTQ